MDANRGGGIGAAMSLSPRRSRQDAERREHAKCRAGAKGSQYHTGR